MSSKNGRKTGRKGERSNTSHKSENKAGRPPKNYKYGEETIVIRIPLSAGEIIKPYLEHYISQQ